jgi:hypothetical protein
MPMRNRVTPLGDIVAIELRGAWTGNRGILHVGHEIVRFHRSDLWITCALQFKDWRMSQWQPGRYTALFFHDEAVALAAGHRPCALCRRPAYDAYRAAWAGDGTAPLAKEIDHRLHAERIIRGTHRRQLHSRSWSSLPTGIFVLVDDEPALVTSEAVVPWTTAGYGQARRRPTRGMVDVITPPSSVAVLSAGYEPQIDAAAWPDAGRAVPSPHE